jgi:hypothetical protein
MADINAVEKQQSHMLLRSDESTYGEKSGTVHEETVYEETAHDVAGKGHLATDK